MVFFENGGESSVYSCFAYSSDIDELQIKPNKHLNYEKTAITLAFDGRILIIIDTT